MKIRNLTLASLLLIVLFAAFGQAQQAQKPGQEKDGYNDNKEHSLPCRLDKIVINGQGPTGKANLDRSDFPDNLDPAFWNKLQNSQFNQTGIDQPFAYTFKFPAWTNSGKECCRCVDGATLTVKLKALQTGGVGTASSGNDGMSVGSSLAPGPSHTVVPGHYIWPNGATAGQIETLTFQIPCKYLTNGHLSFTVQDDTAVLSATLSLTRCCLTDEGRDK
jgi:hypothetical protein